MPPGYPPGDPYSTELLYSPGPLDSDGDGVADVILEPDGTDVVIQRSDGIVRLHRDGVRVGRTAAVGDLDGDGRDDLLVVASSPVFYAVSSGSFTSEAAVRSNSQDAITLPRRQTSAMSRRLRSYW